MKYAIALASIIIIAVSTCWHLDRINMKDAAQAEKLAHAKALAKSDADLAREYQQSLARAEAQHAAETERLAREWNMARADIERQKVELQQAWTKLALRNP